MNKEERLDERIEQLVGFIKARSITIEHMKAELEAARKEKDRLVEQREEQILKLERRVGDVYYYTTDDKTDGAMRVGYGHDYYDELSSLRFVNNNYFHTLKRADEVANKINFLLKLERLRDIYCPNCESGRYYISQNTESGRYCYSYIMNVPNKHPTSTMFPSEEIALKVCNILNKELEEKI